MFVQDRRYLANPPLSEEQYEAVRHIEQVYYPETYKLLAASSEQAVRELLVQPCRMTNLVTLEWGKGGPGRTISAGSARCASLTCCCACPIRRRTTRCLRRTRFTC